MSSTKRPPVEDTRKKEIYALVERYGLSEAARRSGTPVSTVNSWIRRDRAKGAPVPESVTARASVQERYRIVLDARQRGVTRAARDSSTAINTILRWEEEFVQGKHPDYPLPPRQKQHPEDLVQQDGAALRAARLSAGMTQRAVAAAAGIPQPSLVRYEGEYVRCPESVLRRLAEVIGVPYEALLAEPAGDEEKPA